jgi:hypothetical protein
VKSIERLIRHRAATIASVAGTQLKWQAGCVWPLTDPKMTATSRYIEAPRRLRAFVRAHETSLVVLAALIGTIGGLVVLAMSIAVAGLHALLFNISIRERLSSQASNET